MIERLLCNGFACYVVFLVVSLILLARSLGWVQVSLPLWVKIVFVVLLTAWVFVLGKRFCRELADVDLSED